jgi:uncharacterized membrane protein
MNNMLVCVFDGEKSATEAARSLRDLRPESLVLVYAVATVLKGFKSIAVFDYGGEHTPADPALAIATRSLIALLQMWPLRDDEPEATVVTDWMIDMAVAGVDAHFIDEVSRNLLPGKAALVSEIEEETPTPMNKLLESRGGVVFRCVRSQFMDGRMVHYSDVVQNEIKRLATELSQAPESSKGPLQARMNAAMARFQTTRDRTRHRSELIKREAEAKIVLLQMRAASAQGGAKARIERFVNDVRVDYANRATIINLMGR